jgi:hypothetical protein
MKNNESNNFCEFIGNHYRIGRPPCHPAAFGCGAKRDQQLHDPWSFT